jgi:outer membrane protein assembly factor BamB
MSERGAAILISTFKDAVIGRDASTGKVLWSHGGLGGSLIRLAVSPSRVFALAEHLVAFDYVSGRVLWRKDRVVKDSRRQLLLDEDRVYVSSGTHVVCFSLDGVQLWEAPSEGGFESALAVPGKVAQTDLSM